MGPREEQWGWDQERSTGDGTKRGALGMGPREEHWGWDNREREKRM